MEVPNLLNIATILMVSVIETEIILQILDYDAFASTSNDYSVIDEVLIDKTTVQNFGIIKLEEDTSRKNDISLLLSNRNITHRTRLFVIIILCG